MNASQYPDLTVFITERNRLPDLPIQNGQLIFVRDKTTIAFDFGGKRTFYNQISELETDADRLAIEHPVVGTYYFVVDTAMFWTYQVSGWVAITPSPKEIVYIGTELPNEGLEQTLYVNKATREISVWDESTAQYIPVANHMTEMSAEEVEALFYN